MKYKFKPTIYVYMDGVILYKWKVLKKVWYGWEPICIVNSVKDCKKIIDHYREKEIIK